MSSILERLVDVDGGFKFLANLILDMMTKNHIHFRNKLILHPCIFGDCFQTCSLIRELFPSKHKYLSHLQNLNAEQ